MDFSLRLGDKVDAQGFALERGVYIFGKRRKLNPRFVGPFKVIKRVGDVAYKLELPEELSRVHNTFHVSNLKKCHADEPLSVPLDGLHFDDKLQFVEEPIELPQIEVNRHEVPRMHWIMFWIALLKIYVHHVLGNLFSSMSDSEDSTVTYTEISSPYEDLSDVGSPGAEGPIFQDPPSPDYVPGPEEPEQAPPSPIYIPFVPEPVYPEFLPVDDEVFPAEEQPMPAADSPTHQSPGYIPESDPEEDPEEDDEEDPEEDPADYPADRGDDRDDEEPSDDDDDDDDAEEEEHLALTTLQLLLFSDNSGL
ncbi:hypothetical protein Tco_0579286 [Tanacetum coccineum]